MTYVWLNVCVFLLPLQVARIVALQRSITSQRVPIIRHTTCTMATGWPAIVQAI